MPKVEIELPRRSQIQIYYPWPSNNGFGWCLAFPTAVTIGKTAVAIRIFGFGIGLCYDMAWTLYHTPKPWRVAASGAERESE